LIANSSRYLNAKAGTVQRQAGKNGCKHEIAAQKVNERLVELAEIKPGQKVLDIATGIGEPAITAARKLVQLAGSGNKINANIGHVLATDISSQMLTVAKQRAATLGLQEIIEFRESDAEVLALPGSSFDGPF